MNHLSANASAPLAALRDIHAPDTPGFWPPAPGWIALAGLVAVLGLAVAAMAVRRWRAGRFRREALASLQSLRVRHVTGAPDAIIAMELSALVRRVTLARHPREEVAGLTGDRWLSWLDATLPGIGASSRTALLEAPYARQCRFDVARALTACERWIRRA